MGIRLQGTDGIRGPIKQDLPPSENPASWYLQSGEITPEFFQLYTYSICLLLRKLGLAEINSRVIIGWDSRDSSGAFNNAAMLGILQAGLKPCRVGILPTPAVALHMLVSNASAAIVLTASHNPADQNGIKIFLGSTGLKLFPSDDESLTEIVLKQTWPITITGSFYDFIDEAKIAKTNFVKHLFQNIEFSTILDQPESINIITDSAFGACQVIVEYLPKIWRIFQHLNADCSQEINRSSGVADLEGIRWFSSHSLEEDQWKDHAVLHKLFQNQQQNLNVLQLSWVFDGDGDRCFILVADPFRQGIHVLGGDALMLLISSESAIENKNKYVFNTIESDLEASNRTLRKKFNFRQCAVGDKWLLLEAFASRLRTIKKNTSYLTQSARNQIIEIQDALVRMRELGKPSAFELTRLWKKMLDKYPEANQITTDFLLGSEESGHIILPAIYDKQFVFLGNGPLAAFKSTEILYRCWLDDAEKFFTKLDALQPQGAHFSFSVYYVLKKKLLEPVFRRGLIDIIQKKSSNFYPELIQEWISMPEDVELLMLHLKDGEILRISMFVRNSGTEDKLSLYIQGNGISNRALDEFSKEIHWHLLCHCKNKQSSWYQAEAKILVELIKGSQTLSWPENRSTKARLLHEMRNKQKFVNGSPDNLVISELGRRYAQFLAENPDPNMVSKQI
jgi:phosphomannomutase